MKLKHWGYVLMFLAATAGHAAQNSVKATLLLKHIKASVVHERGGDELYMDVAAFQLNKPKTYTQIPKPPNHWPAQQLSKVKSVTLWSDDLKAGEKVVLIVSLMDYDTLSINPDDLIGVIRIELENAQGVLKSKWSLPNQMNVAKGHAERANQLKTFTLSGVHGEYKVALSLTAS